MPHAGFVHLRVHSAYSLSEGAITTKALIKLCTAERSAAVAITDSGNLFGALEFALAAKAAGLQPIIDDWIALAREREGKRNGATSLETDQLVLLVQNEVGYKNLLKLVSRSFLETESGDKPHVTFEWLEEAAEGLLALTGGRKLAVARLLLDNKDDAAAAMLQRLADVFPGRLYVEISRHGLASEAAVEERLDDLAFSQDLPLVYNEAFFPSATDYDAHDLPALCPRAVTFPRRSAGG